VVAQDPGDRPSQWLKLTHDEMLKLRDSELKRLLEETKYPVRPVHLREELQSRSADRNARLALIVSLAALLVSLSQVVDADTDAKRKGSPLPRTSTK
jgi:hypothetical protein